MFFLLSKVLDFVLLPTVWLVALLIAALVARPPRRRRWLVAALALTLLITNPFLVNELLLAWEAPPVALAALPRHADAAVLLTGITNVSKSPHDRVYLGPGADRVTSALWLYRAGRVRRIIVSGGSGAVQAVAHTEADDLTTLLRLAGVPNSAIIREEKSRNTRENALFTRQLLTPEQDTLILVTSAFHQRRAMGCFAKVGLHPIGFPAGYRSTDRRLSPDALLVPNPDAMVNFSLLTHEVTGWLTYKALGYL
ncbi:YdcF family protein [Microvirga sp. STS02]|uniref:YdcF family protein n=1 Tax=Hymenobacter negativus TaxID=2795026 RepID=UPI0018DC5BA0|nr:MULTISPECIES: YdcF family protein [Bacteria]MBH8569101.1 YdcF family protein [Hymenobacter negativus]MBR7208836.1 YdcF family protein [Microvirga sp. STS02]